MACMEVTCPGCGAATAAVSEGLCPGCLLAGVLDRADLEPPEQDDPAALKRCGDYEITGVLARGGMGVVFRARQPGLSRQVALKMIAAADLAAPDEVRRFRLEAELIARLDHPHIVPVHAVGEHHGQPFFVMKLAEGGTLAQQLERSGKWQDVRAAAALMVKVARAVQFAHERGVLHRDLKPANILLDTAGEPLVSDFGLARLTQSPRGSSRTAAAVGTPAYMAPEQARTPAAVTTTSDVYGLGAILYHLLTGRAPFAGDTPLEILRRAQQDEPENPRAVNPAVDRDLATVCLRCLEKTPARRYASAAALAEDLERWQRGEPVAARAPGLTERAWKWARRRPALAALTGAALLGAAGLAAVLAAGNVLLRGERNYARSQERAAKAGALLAEASERAMRLNVYAADMFLARRALDDGHLGVARQTLQRHIPGPGGEDLRGYEWHALHHLCRGDDRRIAATHQGAVLAVAHSPDGKLLATGGRDGVIQICKADGTPVQRLPDHPGGLSKVAELALLSTLPVRSPETVALLAGKLPVDEMRMRARPSTLGEIRALAWSPDGRWLVSAGGGAYVRLWKTDDWSYHGFIPAPQVVQAAFTPDSRQIVVALSGEGGSRARGEVRVYETATLARVRTLTNVAACFALAQEAPLLATVQPDGRTGILDLSSGAVRGEWGMDAAVTALDFSPDGRRLAVLHLNRGALWDVPQQSFLGDFHPAGELWRTVRFSPDGSLLAVGGSSHLVQILDGRTGAPLRSLRGHDDEVLSLTFPPGGETILSGSNDHTARLWFSGPGISGAEEMAESSPLAAASPGGGFLIGAENGVIRCRDFDGGPARIIPSDAGRIPLAFAPDGKTFATWQQDSGLLEWWDTECRRESGPLQIPAAAVTAVCPDKGWIALGQPRGPVALHDWRTGARRQELPPPPLNTLRLTASPDGRYLAAFEWPRTLAVCEVSTGSWHARMTLSPGITGPIVFSPDGTLLATAGDDNLVTVRRPLTGEITASLRGHMAEIKALAFSPDGKTLASSSADRSIRLWHVPTWRELGPLHRGALCPAILFTARGLAAEDYQKSWFLLPGGE